MDLAFNDRCLLEPDIDGVLCMNIKDWPLRLKITLTAAALLSLVSIVLIWQSVSSLDRTVNDTLRRDIDGFAQSI